MKLSKEGLQLLKNLEGCRLKAYLCPAGIWTIGYGHTGHNIKKCLIITQERANWYLEQDIKKFEEVVNKSVKVDLKQNEYDALVLLSFNIGVGAFKSSTLLKLLNKNEDRKIVALEFLKWCKGKVGGRLTVIEGLKARRVKEKQLFERK